MKFLSHFAAKSCDNLKKGTAPAILAAIALLFAAQSPSTRAQDEGGQQDDDGHEATPISDTDCSMGMGTVSILQPGRYFLASDLKNCGISITVSYVKIELRGHTIQQAGPVANVIDANGGTTGTLSNLEIEGPGTITGGSSGIFFGNVHRSRVHNVVIVGNTIDGMDVNSGDVNNTTPSTENEIRDNVVTGNFSDGISVNGGNQNRFINNNLSGNSHDGLFLMVASNNIARRNTADANFAFGIHIGTLGSGNMVEGNTALGNGALDLNDENVNCDNNTWRDNSFTFGSPAPPASCIQ